MKMETAEIVKLLKGYKDDLAYHGEDTGIWFATMDLIRYYVVLAQDVESKSGGSFELGLRDKEWNGEV